MPSGVSESSLGYHPYCTGVLTSTSESERGTVSGRQFDWGGRLLKSNGGARRLSQGEWKSPKERKGIRQPDCEIDISSRCESRS